MLVNSGFASGDDIPSEQRARLAKIWKDPSNAPNINELNVSGAKQNITAWLESQGIGTGTVNYRLRDWLFSRQRYWGEPFPLITLEDGTVKAVPVKDLPVVLPELSEYRPTADGQPPLARATDWVGTTDPDTGKPARRETNTMPQWAGSCWYYLRFCDARNEQEAWSRDAESYWMPVDLYVGGAEHAVLHLLYARFWHKVLYDAGYVSTKEPFTKLFNQGMILAYSYQDAAGKYYYPNQVEHRDGQCFVRDTGAPVTSQIEKMSKSRYNVINPDDVVRELGADSMRLYEMFMGPLDRDKPWTEEGVHGVHRFLRRTWAVYVAEDGALNPKIVKEGGEAAPKRVLHQAIKAITADIEQMSFNTAISRMMEFVNEATKAARLDREDAEKFVLVLAPFAPHLAEELWERLGHTESLAYEPWPEYDEQLLTEDSVDIAVQVLGKLRGLVRVPVDATKEQILEAAKAEPNVQRHIEARTIVKEIYVPGKLVNLVVR
jgi:leucyl-tRNA synthetase